MTEESYPVGFGVEGRLRPREMQLLINVIVPDPRYQPYYLSDDATLFNARDQEAQNRSPKIGRVLR